MKTKEEARKCWCPYTNERGSTEALFLDVVCLASDCMAWRWGEEPKILLRVMKNGDEHSDYLSSRFKKGRTGEVFEFQGHLWRYEYTSHDDGGEFDLLSRPNPGVTKHGYCGLAGKP